MFFVLNIYIYLNTYIYIKLFYMYHILHNSLLGLTRRLDKMLRRDGDTQALKL